MNKTLYISTTFATVLMEIDEHDKIMSAPPIFKTWIGQNYSKFYNYYSKKNKIVKVEIMKKGKLVNV